jgi:hypothetical protein
MRARFQGMTLQTSDSPALSGSVCHRSANPSRREDVQVEAPVAWRSTPAFHRHPTRPGVLGPTRIRYQGVQGCQPRANCLLPSPGVMQPVHGEPCPRTGLMRLIQARAGHWQPGVCTDGRPARFLGLTPAPPPRAVGHPHRGGAVVGQAASALAEGQDPHALALARPVQQRVARCAYGLADRGGAGGAVPRELMQRGAQAVATTPPRAACPQTLGGAVKALGANPVDPGQRLLRDGRTLARAIGLGQSRRPGLRGVTQGPESPAADPRGPGRRGGETRRVLRSGEAIDRASEPTAGDPRHIAGASAPSASDGRGPPIAPNAVLQASPPGRRAPPPGASGASARRRGGGP